MQKGVAGKKLKAFRLERGLTMEQAGAQIVVDGKGADKATWHGWESGKKIPKPAAMLAIERVTAVEPNDFYPRPDAGEIVPPAQAALAL
jgi:transcriptional regulator with XRE-family HTH domain